MGLFTIFRKRSTKSPKQPQSASAASASAPSALVPSVIVPLTKPETFDEIKENIFTNLRTVLLEDEELGNYNKDLESFIDELKAASDYNMFIKILNTQVPSFINNAVYHRYVENYFVSNCDRFYNDPLYRSFFRPGLIIRDSLSPEEVLAMLKNPIQESEETGSDVNPFANAFKALELADTPDPLKHISCTFDSAIPDTQALALSQVYSYLLAYHFMEQIVQQLPKYTQFFLVGSAILSHSSFSLTNFEEIVSPIEGAFLVLPGQKPLYIHLLGIGNAQFLTGSKSSPIGAAGSQSVDSPKIYELEPTGILTFGHEQLNLESLGFNQEPRGAVDPAIYNLLCSCFQEAKKVTAATIGVFAEHHERLHEQAITSLNASIVSTVTHIRTLMSAEEAEEETQEEAAASSASFSR